MVPHHSHRRNTLRYSFIFICLAVGITGLLLFTFGASQAAKAPAAKDQETTAAAQLRPNFDAFANSQKGSAKLSQMAQQPQMEAGHLVQTESRLGVPTFLWASEENRGVARTLPQQIEQRRVAAEAVARQFLGQYASRYHLSSADVGAAR